MYYDQPFNKWNISTEKTRIYRGAQINDWPPSFAKDIERKENDIDLPNSWARSHLYKNNSDKNNF